MIILGIEGGGTKTSALLVDTANDAVLARVKAGPGNLHFLDGASLDALLVEIQSQLTTGPDRIGIGCAGVRSNGDRERLTAAVARAWPGVSAVVTDDLVLALEATKWPDDCAAQVLLVSGTGSCCLGRHRNGTTAKVGGRGHVIGDRGSSCDIALHALRSVVTLSDIHADWPALGSDILIFLQMNDPESLIEWSAVASKAELASLARVVFKAASTRQDDTALAILNRAAERLSKDTVNCAARVAGPDEKVQFVLNGSVFLKNPAFADDVISRIQEARPGSKVIRLENPGVTGAVRMALDPSMAETTLGSLHEPKTLVSNDLATTARSWRPVSASPTELRNPRSNGLSELPISDAIVLMLGEDEKIPEKILAESSGIEWTIRAAVEAFAEGGRLIYCGAGTSGRLGVLDASECPPTFRTPPDLVQGIIAGGRSALWSAVEGAEDDLAAGERAIVFRHVGPHDVVVGISASGHAPFIWGCLEEAKRRGAKTVLVCCNPSYRDHPLLDAAILPNTGPELLTGSTRLKSGTATKLVLNLITTLAMTHSGKVMSNLMIDLNPSNAKLRNRAVRIVSELTGATEELSLKILESNGWIVRDACESLQETTGRVDD